MARMVNTLGHNHPQLGPALQHQIGQGGALFMVKPAPVVGGAQHFPGVDRRQAFARAVPDDDFAVTVEREGWNDQQFHHFERESMRLLRLRVQHRLPLMQKRRRKKTVRRKIMISLYVPLGIH